MTVFFKAAAITPAVIFALIAVTAGAAEPGTRPTTRPTTQPAPTTSAELFQRTAVWTVHLRFTAEQWAAMEPKNTFPGFGGPGGPAQVVRAPATRPGAPVTPVAAPRPIDFGPASFLAPVFMRDGDQNKDGKLSRDEFAALAEKWFTAWDKDKTGRLNADQLRRGLDATLSPGPAARGPGFGLLGPEGKRNGLASAAGIEFVYVHADLEFNGQTLHDVGIRYKGNGTWMQSRFQLKRSLKIETNKYVKGQKFAGVTKINLHTNVTDVSWMNEVLSHELFRDAGVPAPRTAYARVYITVPGKHDHRYFGLYSIVEDIDTHFAQDRFNTKKGDILKPVTPDLFADLGDDWAAYNQIYDPKTVLSDKEKRRIIEFCRFLANAGDADFAARLPEYVNLDEFARFMATTVYLSTLDSILALGQNLYVYLDHKTQKFQFLPWDLDHSFGQFPMMSNQEQRENLSIHHPWRGENRFLERVFKVDAFKKIYLAKLDEFSRSIFKPERFHQQVDETAAAIRPAIQEESASLLAGFDRVVATPGAANRPANAPADQPGRGGFRGGFGQPKPIKGFVNPRSQSILDQLAGKSQGQTLDNFGGFGGRGPGRPGGPGGPSMFSPAGLVTPSFMTALDANKDGQITREEFLQGFARWFDTWNTDKTGQLTEDQLRAGLNQILPRPAPPRNFGPPPGAPI
ncbi:MAG: CotH kinase family protein [Tepidisphaerales bacterium]